MARSKGWSTARRNPDSPSAALWFRAEGDLVTVAGTMPGIQPGERLHLKGRWINHPIHGYQFRADSYSSQLPASANAVRRYLASSLVKGIGPVLAGRLVDCFGDETLRVIDEQPERLAEAPGVGPRRLESIKRAWVEQQEIRGVMLFLQGHGVSAAYSTRIYKTYGQDAVKVVQENPYRLAQDVRGIGFITADKIARQMGIDEHSPHRAQAALEYLLLEQAGEGHVFSPNAELVQECRSSFRPPRGAADGGGGKLAKDGTDRAGWRGSLPSGTLSCRASRGRFHQGSGGQFLGSGASLTLRPPLTGPAAVWEWS